MRGADERHRRSSALLGALAAAVLALSTPAHAQPAAPPGGTGATGAASLVAIDAVDRATVRVLTIEGTETRLVRGNHLKHWFAFPRVGHGSGVSVTDDGLILTAAHVIESSVAVFVKLPEVNATFPATVVYRDDAKDLALLSIRAKTPAFLEVPEGSNQLAVRQRVNALGYPMDPTRPLPQSSQGIVAGLMPNGMLQLSIAVNPGNSGGPLIDEQNRLLAIVVARGDPTIVEGVAMAVPIHFALDAYRDLRTRHRTFPAAEDNGQGDLLLEAAFTMGDFVEVSNDRLSLRRDAWQTLSTLNSRHLGPRLENARRGGSPADALFAASISAFQWNLAVLLREQGNTAAWAGYRKSSAEWAHWACATDPRLHSASHFLRMARRRAVVDYGLAP